MIVSIIHASHSNNIFFIDQIILVIGADILDKTNQNAFTFGRLREEPTWWELDTAQRIHFDEVGFYFKQL